MNLLLMTSSLQEHFLQMLQASFTLLILLLSFVLPKPILQIDTKFLSMVLHTWTNISISNWQFLIPCYHQNSQEVMLNTFCSNTLRSEWKIMNEKSFIYILGFHLGLGLKTGFFSLKSSKKQFWPTTACPGNMAKRMSAFSMPGAHGWCPRHMNHAQSASILFSRT